MAKHRTRNKPVLRLPPLVVSKILTWARDHFRRFLVWPGVNSGPVLHPEGKGEDWRRIYFCAKKGRRGLPGQTLAQLLKLLIEKEAQAQTELRRVLREFHKKFGRIPTFTPKDRLPGLPTWSALEARLFKAQGECRTLRQLAKDEGLKNPHSEWSRGEILELAKRHYAQTGSWPHQGSGKIPGDPLGRSFAAINQGLRLGKWGFTKGMTLSRLIREWQQGSP